MENNQKGIAPIIIALIVAVVLGGGYMIAKAKGKSSPKVQNTTVSIDTETASWKTYTNEKYGFEFKYPNGSVDSTKYGPCHQEVCLTILSDPMFSVVGPMRGDISSYKNVPKDETSTKTEINDYQVVKNEMLLPFYYGAYYFIQNPNDNKIWEITASESKFPAETVEQYNKKIDNLKYYLNEVIFTFKFTAPSAITTTEMSVTIMVPSDMNAYVKATNAYIFDGKPNPSATWPFIKKQVTVPNNTDIIKASAQAVAEVIPTQGGFEGSRIVYFKLVNGTAYILLRIHVDGWAGVSASLAAIDPLVEKTLLQFPEITSVKFSPAPGDTMDSISTQ